MASSVGGRTRVVYNSQKQVQIVFALNTFFSTGRKINSRRIFYLRPQLKFLTLIEQLTKALYKVRIKTNP
jgi:hypothetical protein